MKTIQNLVIVILFTAIPSFLLFAQSRSGIVTDTEGEALIGVNIIIQGTTRGTVTDIDGRYSIEAESGEILVFSYIGYQTREITVSESSEIDVILTDGAALEEVVVVGYGQQRKVTVTGAVSALSGNELNVSPAVDISNSLAGRLPGLVVVQTSGEPGNDGANISIRGINTLGNNSPLIIIDGIPDREGGLGRLSPQDIESISVLKDASAAIYGARAANGAILITTKRGASGKPTIDYSLNLGWSQPTVVPEMSNAWEYANIMNEIPIYKAIPYGEWGNAWQSIQSSGSYDSPTEGVTSLNANYNPESVQAYKDGSDPWKYPDTDWFGDAFKKWSPQQRHYLSLAGGTENLRYMSSMGYTFQDAYYKNSATFYKQYNFRVNLDARVNDFVQSKIGVMARREDRNYPTQSSGSIFRMLMRGRPTEPEVWPNGLPGPDIENGQNPYVITTSATGYNKNPTDYLQMNGSVDITNPWVEGLTLTLLGSIDKLDESFKIWQTPWMLYYWDKTTYGPDGEPLLTGAVRSNFTDPRLEERYEKNLNTNLSGLLNYDFTIGQGNDMNVMAGITKEKFNGSNFSAYRRNFLSPAIDQLFAGGIDGQTVGGGAYDRARLGYYGRVQYNRNDTYLAEFIWRYDGSYIFPEDGRFGFFPGILLGWNITEENWFSVNNLDRLKFRFSYGEMGNDQVFFSNQLQEYAFLSTYGFGQYPLEGAVQKTLVEEILANPSFTWERARNLNFGIDGTLFGNFDFTFEYFHNNRDKILIQKTGSTPASSGISSLLPPVNAGEVKNQGVEYSFQYNWGTADQRFAIGTNGGYARNEVIFMDEVPGAPEYQWQEGKPIGAYLVYESDGVFKDQAEIDANTIDYSGVTGQLLPGDMKFKDVNGDGVIDGDDKVRLNESNVPKFNYGFTFSGTWKNFDFGMLWQGAAGSSIRVQTESGDIGNFLKYSYDNRWSIDNPSSEHPRLASRGDTYYTGGSYGNNTYFLFSKNYVRLKNLEIGYRLNRDVFKSDFLQNLRFYANGLNLLTFNKYKIFDPENNNSAGVYYPQSRVINIGFNVTF